MIQVTGSPHVAGTVILAAGNQPRHHEFIESLDGLLVPDGTTLQIVRSCDVAQNFNKGVRAMTGQWAWFLGDDHAFEPDSLLRLLDHRMDVVVPITPCKQPFGYPFVLHGRGDGEWRDDMQTYSWAELSGAGLKALPKGDFIGQAGMLVRKRVLDEIGDPWFKCGQFNEGRLQEDMAFCRELQLHGFRIWIDQDMILDHYMLTQRTARKHHDVWLPAIKFDTYALAIAGADV